MIECSNVVGYLSAAPSALWRCILSKTTFSLRLLSDSTSSSEFRDSHACRLVSRAQGRLQHEDTARGGQGCMRSAEAGLKGNSGSKGRHSTLRAEGSACSPQANACTRVVGSLRMLGSQHLNDRLCACKRTAAAA